MKMSRRAKRMERHHKRKKSTTGFNLVSLMDIFTILVFFLLVNSAESELLKGNKSFKLPESVAEKKPKETLVVMVNNESILVQGRKIATVNDALDPKAEIISALKAELEYRAKKLPARVNKEGKPVGHEITIMGDREIPYKLLKRIMVTCAKSNFGNISLAVLQKSEAKG